MNAKNKVNKERARLFANDVLQKVQELIEEHNNKVSKMNDDVESNNKIIKKIPAKSNFQLESQFYKYAEDTAERLKLMNKKLGSSQKIKKERRDIYEGKISMIIGYINQIIDERTIKVMIDHWLIKWTQEMGQNIDEVQKHLLLLQKQSRGFCFGGDKTTNVMTEKGLIDIITYGQFWQLLAKVTPITNREIQNKFVELEYEESIFNDIDKMVIDMWPQPEVIQIPVEHVVQKIVVKQRQASRMVPETSIKQEIEKKELQDKNQKLTKELNMEKTLRQAHQMLIGLGRSQNIGKAIQIYKNIPEINHSQARESIKTETELKINPLICNVLGCLYEQGKYIPKDMKKAVEYYIKSASVQDSQGLYKIGKFLQKKMVNPLQLFEQGYANRHEQIKDAIEHYQKAAQKGHLDAITDLGHIYQNGIRKQQAKNNSAISKSQVSNSQVGEFIIEPNLDYAVKYYQLAKKQEFPRGLNNLGAMYIRINQKIPQTMKGSNIERGIKYLKRATELQYAKAYLNLGKCYEKGIGVKKSLQKAKSLFVEGSDLGDNQCKLQYINCLLDNEIQADGKNQIKMQQYLRQILLQEPNNGQALYLMGLFHEKGMGVQINPQSAFYYISKAAKLDHSPSLVKLGDYYYSAYYADRSIDRAKICYQKAAVKGNSQGFINLGLLYEKGLIQLESKADQLQVARNYFLEAAKLGNPNAFIFLSKEGYKDIQSMKQAAELGSNEALKLLAKTSSTVELQTKAFEKGRAEYQNILNQYIKDANKNVNDSKKQVKKTQAPMSPKMRQMMIYSPRERPQIPSNLYSPRYTSPKNPREGYKSQQYFRQ